ncbi:MAG: calcium/sodium antiporter [Spirochaetales bacterium]|nr:calcium/sodium antiporter [Spirochaetales bacterium]
MEHWLVQNFQSLHILLLFLIIAASLFLLSRGADILVDEAVSLSVRWGIPKVLIGATVVSLGTTLPEATVSVAAAVGGNPDVALGNAVGSIICDTSLIIGVAALIRPLPIEKSVTNKQGWVHFAAGVFLVLTAIQWGSLSTLFQENGTIPQWIGFLFLFLLVIYMYRTTKKAKTEKESDAVEDLEAGGVELDEIDHASTVMVVLKLGLGLILIIISSKVLIPAVQVTAVKIGIPKSIIAATLVAFGTSLPELTTAISASRRGHGELAIGNVIGADVLNVLFVVGASAAVTPQGLEVPSYFYWFHFPIMLLILMIYRISLFSPTNRINRLPGALLLGFYLVFSVASYLII